MSVKADWGAAVVEPPTPVQDFDPFGWAESGGMPMKAVNMETPANELHGWLGELLRREGNLDACGITCPLKDLPDATCTACPVSRVHDTSDPHRQKLCEIGVEQERVLMLLMAQRVTTQDHGG